MPNIAFPSPAGYTDTPWTDGNGKLWIADSKGRFSEFVAPGASAWADLTDKATAPLTTDNTALAAALAGKQPLSSVLTATTASFTTADETKLDGVAAGATAAGATGDAYATSHEVDSTAHPAAYVSNVPAGNISATTVQAAINELDAEKAPALGSDDNYATDAEKIKLANLSGVNTGDETPTTIVTKVAGQAITPLSARISKGDETAFAGFTYSLTTPQDPGTPLNIEGRGALVHGLSITAGSANFTNGSDHAHFIQQSQYGLYWQRINGGGSYGTPNAKSRMMLHTPAKGVVTTAYNTANIVSVDSRSISPATPVAPGWTATDVIINYATSVALTVGQKVQVAFSPGLAGFVGGRYPGTVTQSPTLVGAVYEVRLTLFYLTTFNFTVADKSIQDVPLNALGVKTVILSTFPNALPNGTLLEPVTTLGQNRFRASFSTAHGLSVGEAVALEILEGGLLGKSTGFYDAYVHKVESSTSVICSMGSMIADYNYQPALSGSARVGPVGWSMVLGNTDPVHQPIASLQSYMFEREENSSSSSFGQTRLFNIGPANECYNSGSFTVGFGNTVLNWYSAAIGRDNIVTGSSTVVIGNNHNWASFLDSGVVIGIGGNALYVGAWGMYTSTDNGITVKSLLSATNPPNFNGGPLTFSGAANVTLTMPASGTVAYTFPTTTATLARTDAGQTFAGAQAFSTRPTSTEGGLPAQTSLVTLADADDSQYNRLGQLFFPRKSPELSNFGTASFATVGNVGNVANLCLASGTTSVANAWSRAIIQDGLNSSADFTGAGIYGLPISVAVSLMSNFNTADRIIRILVGTPAASPATSGNAAFTAKGFGLEIVSTGSSTSIRAIAHNGTTYYGSAALVQISNSPLWDLYRVFEIKSDNAGNVTASCRLGRTILGTSTLTTGPVNTLGGRYVEINGSTNGTFASANQTISIQDWAIKLY